MKKLLVSLALLLSYGIVSAQSPSWYIGGMAGYGSRTNKIEGSGDKGVNSNWSFSPEFGITDVFKEGLQIGGSIGLGGNTSKFAGDKNNQTTRFDPTIYVRNYFNVTDEFSVFAGLYFSYLSGNTKNYTYLPLGAGTVETKTSHNGFGTKLGLGVAYALSDRFTVMGQYGLLNFSSVNNKGNDGNKTDSDTNFEVGMNTVGGSVFNVGLYYTIIK